MSLKSRSILLAFGFVVGLGGWAAADQPNFTTAVIAEGTAPGLIVGMRTSNTGAAFTSCTISGGSATCTVENGNSGGKKIGNIMCLPQTGVTVEFSPRCSSMLNAGSGSCSKNSASGQCPSGTMTVAPVCNYTTNESDSVTANWVWIVYQAAASTWKVDCLQAGFSGYSP